jgi:hypothetical protein
VNVTSQVEKGYGSSPRSDITDLAENTHSLRTNGITSSINRISTTGTTPPRNPLQLNSESPIFETPSLTAVSYSDDICFVEDGDQYMHAHTTPNLPYHGETVGGRDSFGKDYTTLDTHEAFLNDRGPLRSRINTEDAADLLALRYMPSQRQTAIRPTGDSQIVIPPQVNASIPGEIDNESALLGDEFKNRDGIFLPGSVYQEFHSTLRDHLIYTAKSNAPSRHETPELPDLSSRSDELGNGGESDPDFFAPGKTAEITPQREFILWKAWIDEIAPWVMCSEDRLL